MANHEPHESTSTGLPDNAEQRLTPESSSESINFDQILQDLIQSRNGSGIAPRELGVVFENLDVVGCGTTASYQTTIGSKLNPLNLINAIQQSRHPPIRNILTDFEGVVRPGEMLLVLGRPGSGCSTLLKVLANQRQEFYQIHGDLSYDAITPDEMTKYYRGDVQYCPENDVHFPTLTTWQTIQFAARLRAPPQGSQPRLSYASKVADLLMTLFGVQHTKSTPVGDASVRGVSGGEKKRVSICEALATRAQLTCWDNSTRGLDSSTALEFVETLRGATDTARLTTIASLYQAGEQLYKLFDTVCLIYEGRMIYFGPAHQARQYFIDLGYEPAPRQTTADFLVSVTDPKARICRNPTAPRSPAEFAAAFIHSPAGVKNKEDISTYVSQVVGNPERREAYISSAVAEHASTARKSSPYLLSILMQAEAVSRRSAQIFKGTLTVKAVNLLAFTFQALIMGTVFLRLPDTTTYFYSRSGVIYFALLFSAMMSMSEIPALFSQRPIVLRHRNWGLYHPFIEAVALTVVDIPVTFVSTVVFGGLIYLLVGLQRSAGQFFTYFVILLVNAITMKAYFRAVAAACKSEAVAQTLAGISVFFLSLYTGYAIPEESMIWPLRWITYINPFKYGFEALMVNEFRTLNSVCTNLVPQGPGYQNITLQNQVCTTVGAVPGQPRVEGLRFTELSLGYSYNHLWRNFGIMIVFCVVFILSLFLFTQINTGASAEKSGMIRYKIGSKIEEAEAEDSSPTDANAAIEKISAESRSSQNHSHPQNATKERSEMVAQASEVFAREVKTNNVFTFSHISYTIPVGRGQTRRLLDDVSGLVAPGKLTALMGETGAGKTTLLNVLAGRTEIGVVAGERTINGHPLPEDFQSQTGYCQQLDTHVPRSTVREALLFSAKLRQPMSVPLKEKEDYVDTLLHICGLWSRRHAMVGSLSLEYSKRTTIGVELAAKPKLLLFLDEPTSGLDTQSAWNIVAFLKSLAEHGLAVLCTIHQPSAELFHFFDTLLLLQNGGKTVYFGDLGPHSETLLQYFASHGARECRPEENPAEYMLEIIGAGTMTKSTQNWYTVWSKSAERTNLEHHLEEIQTEGLNHSAAFEFSDHRSQSQYHTPWTYQLVELVKRGMLDYYRDSTYLSAKLMMNTFCGLLIGLSFLKKEGSVQGTQNSIFAIFMGLFLSVPLANQLLVPYIATRSIYEIRERPSGIYSWSALITSQILVEAPWNILGSSLYFVTWYWTAGFSTDRAGYTYLVLGIIFPLYYTTIGQSVACMAPTAEVAAILFGFLFSFVLTFNGVMQPFRALGWWKWMYHVSPFTYVIGGIVAEVLSHRKIVCSAIELVHITPPTGLTCGAYMSNYMSFMGGYLLNPSASEDCQFCALRDTDEFLAGSFNMFYVHRWRDLGVLCAFTVFNIITIYLFSYFFRFHTGSLWKWRSTHRQRLNGTS